MRKLVTLKFLMIPKCIILFVLFLSSCASKENQEEELNDKKLEEAINTKNKIIASPNNQANEQLANSIFESFTDNPLELMPFAQLNDFIVPFNYSLDEKTVDLINKDTSYPASFKNSLLNKKPVYLFVQMKEVNWSGGNRFADGGLSSNQVGNTYHYGNYQSENGNMYIIHFLYLKDKNEESANASAKIEEESKVFETIEVCRVGKEGKLNFIKQDFQVGAFEEPAPINASFTDWSVYSNGSETLADKILLSSYIDLKNLWNNIKYTIDVNSQEEKLVLTSGDKLKKRLKWNKYLEDLSSSAWYIRPDANSLQKLVSNEIISDDGTKTSSKIWVNSLSETNFEVIENLIKEVPTAESENKITMCWREFCLGFEYINQEWVMVSANEEFNKLRK